MKKISVVTVCRNALAALEKTIDSVAGQTARDSIEFVVVDGASTDGTAGRVAEMTARGVIDRSVSEADRGIYDAMNKGVAMSSGEWVIFMNAGDVFVDNNTVERILADGCLDTADVVYGDVMKNGETKRAGEPRNCHRMFFCHQSCLGRRDLLATTPFDTRHRLSADFKWVKTMLRDGRRFRHLDFAVADFDTSGVSNTRRSEGLRDNMSVVMEMDRGQERLRLMSHLVVPYLVSRLRGK